MMERHLIGRGIRDEAVLSAIETTPREMFVSQEQRGCAYDDNPLPIGLGQTISQPYIVALMLEKLRLTKGDTVLEVGCGSGYQAAVMARLASDVYTIEILDSIAAIAIERFRSLGSNNIHLKVGDGNFGWSENGPYNKIIIAAAASSVPSALEEQIAEGGKIIMPVGDTTYQELVLGRKLNNKTTYVHLNAVRFVPLLGDVDKI